MNKKQLICKMKLFKFIKKKKVPLTIMADGTNKRFIITERLFDEIVKEVNNTGASAMRVTISKMGDGYVFTINPPLDQDKSTAIMYNERDKIIEFHSEYIERIYCQYGLDPCSIQRLKVEKINVDKLIVYKMTKYGKYS